MKRRRVVCDGVNGVLAYHDGQWVLENEAELAILDALSGRSDGVGRLRGITAALNSPAAGAEDVTRLNVCLRSIANTEPVCGAKVEQDLMAATAVACAYWNHPNAIQWLCWALSARFDDNLSRSSSVGPGWNSFEQRSGGSSSCGQWGDAGWLRWVGEDFWNRLANHEDQMVCEIAEATDSSTSQKRLEGLCVSYYKEVRDVILSRPDIPHAYLRHYAIRTNDRFIGNPINTGHRAGTAAWAVRQNCRLAQNLSIDAQVIHHLAGRGEKYTSHTFYWLLINHPNRKDKTLDRIANVSCRTVAYWVAYHPSTQANTLKRIIEKHPIGYEARGYCPNCLPTWKIHAAAVANPAMPAKTLSKLVNSRHYEVRAAVAANPSTDIADLEKLARDSRLEVRAAAAANPRLPTALLEELALDRCTLVRRAVADNPEAPCELLAQLARDPQLEVRRRLCYPDYTPELVLDILASDSDYWVTYLVAKHESTPQSALTRLARDSDVRVRWRVADNPSCPVEVLAQLADDTDWWVRESVAEHQSSPAKVLEQLAADPYWQIRVSVAANSSSPPSVLAALVSDQESLVRRAVAENPSTPTRALEQLAGDSNPTVLEELASNPLTPTGVLERLAQTEWARVFHPALDALANQGETRN